MWLAKMVDPDGVPRAWGQSADRGAAETEAARQLEAYRARKREVGDPLADADYTLESKETK